MQISLFPPFNFFPSPSHFLCFPIFNFYGTLISHNYVDFNFEVESHKLLYVSAGALCWGLFAGGSLIYVGLGA
jgi:hypothetical protein